MTVDVLALFLALGGCSVRVMKKENRSITTTGEILSLLHGSDWSSDQLGGRIVRFRMQGQASLRRVASFARMGAAILGSLTCLHDCDVNSCLPRTMGGSSFSRGQRTRRARPTRYQLAPDIACSGGLADRLIFLPSPSPLDPPKPRYTAE